MRRIALFTALLVIPRLAVSDVPNLEILKPLVGQHPVLAWQMNNGAPVRLSIQADESGVGWFTTRMGYAPETTPETQMVSPFEATTLYQDGNRIIQQATGATGKLSTEYELYDGYFTIDTTVCLESGVCNSYLGIVSLGKAPGEAVDAQAFLTALAGSYRILKAGGEKIEKEETLDVDPASDPSETAIYAPFCEPGENICDMGYNAFRYDQVRIYKTSLSRGNVFYDLLVSTAKGLQYYTWEERNGRYFFRNYQYVLPTSKRVVFLEHEVEKLANY